MKSVLVLLFTYLFLALSDDAHPDIVWTATVIDVENRDADGPYPHPDFNYFTGDGPSTGMVEEYLGDDYNPVLIGNGNGKVTSKDSFAQWWTPSEYGKAVEIQLTSKWDPLKKAYTVDNPNFFPIDGEGWDEDYSEDYHNFGFCLVFRNQFTYTGGEIFSFTGDDDVWVFINSKLELDLGGPHPPMSGDIHLDSCGLELGYTYRFDMFYCERHKYGSTLKFSTTIKLDPCGTEDADGDGVADLCDFCPFGDPDLDLTVSGSGLTQTFNIDVGTNVRDGLEFDLDFGDGETTEIYSAINTKVVHTYQKAGTFTATISSDALTGCAAGSDSVEVTITADGSRIAPKCSSIPLMPGSDGGLQRRK